MVQLGWDRVDKSGIGWNKPGIVWNKVEYDWSKVKWGVAKWNKVEQGGTRL